MNRRRTMLMRQALLVAVVILIMFLNSCNSVGQGNGDLVLFYDVPLECGAAPDLGCGSRAKPVFLEMEQHKDIREAWLNRLGTIIAVVSRQPMTDVKQFGDITGPIFAKYNISAAYIDDRKRQDELISEFRADGKWYRGADVDKLSIEEAGLLAETAVGFARGANLIDDSEAQAIRSDVESYMKQDLVKVRTYDELCASEGPRYAAVYAIYEKHIGKERAEKVRKFYEEE